MSLTWKGEEVEKAMENAVRGGIDEVMALCIASAIPMAPIKTGALRGSIRMEPAQKRGGAIVGRWGSFSIRYAIYQELGTIYMAGKHFLRRAADRHYHKLPRLIRKRLVTTILSGKLGSRFDPFERSD